jgi:hypothetical protein
MVAEKKQNTLLIDVKRAMPKHGCQSFNKKYFQLIGYEHHIFMIILVFKKY